MSHVALVSYGQDLTFVSKPQVACTERHKQVRFTWTRINITGKSGATVNHWELSYCAMNAVPVESEQLRIGVDLPTSSQVGFKC